MSLPIQDRLIGDLFQTFQDLSATRTAGQKWTVDRRLMLPQRAAPLFALQTLGDAGEHRHQEEFAQKVQFLVNFLKVFNGVAF